MLQSPPVASQLPLMQGVWLANAVPSPLHLVSVFPSHANLSGAHFELVQLPATLLHRASV